MKSKFLLGVWNVGIIEEKIERALLNPTPKIRWMRHKYKDRFFADPFLYNVDDKNYYILAEEFPFYDPVGYISLLTIDKKTMKLKKKKTIISESWHLSYPFVLNGEIIPEAYRSGNVYAYKEQDGKMVKRTLLNKGLIDQTFLHYNGYEWIFATDKENALAGLKIFFREEGAQEWIAHPCNPIKNDVKTARPGGHFFTLNGELFRPVQDSEERYGRKIRIMKVNCLTPTEFQEVEISCISADANPPYSMGFHTFNVEKDFIVVDGFKEYYSYIINPLCVKLPWLMRLFGGKR